MRKPLLLSLRDPQFRRLVARGVEWVAHGRVTLSPKPMNWITPEERDAGFERVFDGLTTEGWVYPELASCWKLDRASLTGMKASKRLTIDQKFGDFELRFSWATTRGGKQGALAHLHYRPGDRIDAAVALDATQGTFRDARVLVHDGRVEHWVGSRLVTAYALPAGGGVAPFHFSV